MAVRTIDVRERVMAKNDELADDVRRRLAQAGVLTFNLVSSPGSGKTTLLERTLDELGEELSISIVTGDVQTQNDADRLARHTDRLVQAVVTNGACHLDARQITTALDAIDLERTRRRSRGVVRVLAVAALPAVGGMTAPAARVHEALRLQVAGVVQGVGFR